MRRMNGHRTLEGMLNNSAVHHNLATLFSTSAWKRIKWMNPRVSHKECYRPTRIEHIANIITHGLWIGPSFLGMFQLLIRSQNSAQTVAAIVYGTTLALLFSISTCFHCGCFYNKQGAVRDVLHRCDRAVIHIFIAGSYFPWLTLEKFSHESLASMMMRCVWFLAICGILYQQCFHEKYKSIEIIIYLFNGIGPAILLHSQHFISGISELMAGGMFYLVGVVFFKSDGIIPFAHAIWHVFVAIGAGIHYQAILNCLYPQMGHKNTQLL